MYDRPSQENSNALLQSRATPGLGCRSRFSDPPTSPGRLSFLLSRLDGVKKGSKGWWQACCPAHEDRNPSLGVKQVDDGTVIVNCFAGCSTEDVVRAVGLDLKDLFPPRPSNGSSKRQVVTEYVYRCADGTPALKVLRDEPKDFRQQCWDGKDWSWQGKKPKLLYRLPELLAKPERAVFVVEGEQDADRLAKLCLLATCNPGGAGKWRDEYSAVLSGHPVILLPDNDMPGKRDVLQKADSLLRHGCKVRVVELAGVPEHGDVSTRCVRLAERRSRCRRIEEDDTPGGPADVAWVGRAAETMGCGSGSGWSGTV